MEYLKQLMVTFGSLDRHLQIILKSDHYMILYTQSFENLESSHTAKNFGL